MAESSEDAAAAELAREMFAALGSIRTKRMFGGAGVYCDGLFFALIADGELYLKADAALAEDLVVLGSQQFAWTNPKTGAVTRMGYWRLPEAAVDDFDLADGLGRRALQVARRAAEKPGSRRKAKA